MIKAGPLAATVEDAALAYAVLARSDIRGTFYDELYDGGVKGPPKAHLLSTILASRNANLEEKPLAGVVLGIFSEWNADASAGVKSNCEKAIAKMVRLGAIIRPIAIPNLGWLRLAHAIKITSEFTMAWDSAMNDPSVPFSCFSVL